MTQVQEVSKAVIQRSSAPISNLKLQKLLYYVQGWSLAIHEKPAFPEPIEAWVHGPVVPAIFHQYRHFRWNPISIPTEVLTLPKVEVSHIDAVLKVYGGLNAVQLEDLSHEETPWIEARKRLAPNERGNDIITHESMKIYFASRMNA
jgi:uncharacterized phage-associated protein